MSRSPKLSTTTHRKEKASTQQKGAKRNRFEDRNQNVVVQEKQDEADQGKESGMESTAQTSWPGRSSRDVVLEMVVMIKNPVRNTPAKTSSLSLAVPGSLLLLLFPGS
jgi:hypothetical protein